MNYVMINLRARQYLKAMAQTQSTPGGRTEFVVSSDTTEEHADWISGHLHTVLDISHARMSSFKNQLPCAQPTSISAKRADALSKTEYMLTPKADGTRYFIIFCSMANTPVALALNRSMKLTVLDVDVPASLFNGTILDCELMSPTQLLAFDVLQFQGESLKRRTFVYRQQKLFCLDQLVLGTLTVEVKKCWPFDKVGLKNISQCEYSVDGYILQHIREQVVIGRSKASYRVKTIETIDVLFRAKKGFLQSAGNPVAVDSVEPSISIEAPDSDGVWECTVTATGNQLAATPTLLRTDKIEANDVSTLKLLYAALVTNS